MMTIEAARGLAAQAWTTPGNREKEFDGELGEAFAQILLEVDRGGPALPVMSVKRARGWVESMVREKASALRPETAAAAVNASVLLEAMALLLAERVNEAVFSDRFMAARRTMANAFEGDADLRHTYVANVAMLLFDRFNRADFGEREAREAAAIAVLDLIFAG